MKTSNKILLIAFVVVIAIITTVLIVAKKYNNRRSGAGPKFTEETSLDPFNKIEVLGGFEIEFIKSSDSKIEVNADSVVHQHITIDVKDSILTIKSDAFSFSQVKCSYTLHHSRV